MTSQTPTREAVDQFDCELYDLILSAHRWGETDPAWKLIWARLSEIRPHVRNKMHPEDRAATS